MTREQLQAQPPVGLIRIEAPSYREALRQIGDRFGGEVSIVHTRVVRRKGVKGLLGVTGVEVYVTDRQEYEAWRARGNGGGGTVAGVRSGATSPGTTNTGAAAPVSRGREIETGAARTAPALSTVLSAYGRPALARAGEAGAAGAASAAGQDVLGRLEELQEHMRVLLRCSRSETATHPLLTEARALLEERRFSPEAISELLAALSLRQLPGTSGDPAELRALARIQLAELIRPKVPPCVPITMEASAAGGGPRVIVMVGPTGVGKTTTIAKLASPLRLAEGRRVGLLTLDTYRIGAVDQLRRYGEIMGLPLEVVAPGGELHAALGALGPCDVVFVDTAGRSQRDEPRLREIRSMLEDVGEIEVHLCVSLTSSRETLLDVVQRFDEIGFDRVLVTKTDEAPHAGHLYDMVRATRVPLSYLTCGQEVPDDIQAASSDRLIDRMLGS